MSLFFDRLIGDHSLLDFAIASLYGSEVLFVELSKNAVVSVLFDWNGGCVDVEPHR